MDPRDSLNVLFHFGGEFIRVGHVLQYVGEMRPCHVMTVPNFVW
jgi:hypothetical protein